MESTQACSENNALHQAGKEGLSPREREVAELAAAGLSDAEIAEQLFVGICTVRSHIRAVLHKLSLKRRAQIAHALRDLVSTTNT
jgi:DNA-binding CsgD family transcriptional regulator